MEPQPAGASADEERLRLIIEAAPNAMVMVDSDGRIVLVNSEAERSFGYGRDELLRLRVEDLVPADARAAHQGYRSSYLGAPSRRVMGVGRELHGLRKDGTELPIEIGLNPIRIGEEQFVLASIIDISERLRGQAALAAAREDGLRRSILDTIPLCIIATDCDGRITTANPAAQVLLGRRKDELVGSWLTEIDAEPRDWRSDGPRETPPGEDQEWAYVRGDGSTVPVSEAVVALRGEDGQRGFLVVAHDISKRVEARQRFEHMVSHDALTNLPNRASLMTHLEAAFAAAEPGRRVALLLLDLDRFQRVNDSLGHHVGDELLLQVADRLHAYVGEGDLVARLGGDEFALVLTDDGEGPELTERLELVLEEALAPVEVLEYQLAMTASIGGALFPEDGCDPATLLRHADTALDHAKAAGRDNLQWFEEKMLDATRDDFAMSTALRRALDAEELSVVYQPQLDLDTGEFVGVEALARWNSPDLGPVPPDRFIPVAEDRGTIMQLGEWVLRRACVDVAAAQRRLGRPLRLAVNVSPRQLRSRTWISTVVDALAEAGLEPKQLEIEITEGLLIDDHGDAIAILTALHELGVRIAIDDFGRGYSSLAYLTRFPIDRIKIDRSFVHGITGPGRDAAIVDAVIVMAHALGMEVVAEGVETADQERYLRARGCDEVQGFRYSPGVPSDRLGEAMGVVGAMS
ncbi:EAL domain-containing protein [Nocardioides sp. TF02-7]|uniref:putative bifunctional diguanylate cyclase/phosphodiesterase n=1 Tax=Nocardioides sp. TF02-7 TaxID=2917724 RepID=UPI001F059B3A|nr:EAL domain-containing protein [Nocardioides sp. TF02-7]UMG91905.1 EAL domain-containing protein [Nocardioides sp. TF02-7]